MDESAHRTCSVLKVLGNPVRYQIFMELGKTNSLTSSNLCDILGREQSSVSHQLSELKQHDLIQSIRDERKVYYSIKREDVFEKITEFEELFQR